MIANALRLVLWLLALAFQGGNAPSHKPAVIDGPVHEGVEVTIDLPADQLVENIGLGPNHDVGCCVWASLDMAARWHTCRPLIGIIGKMREGGGWPGKMDEVMKEFNPSCKYEQFEGVEPSMLDEAMAKRTPVLVTYGYGELYVSPSNPSGTISHMVLLVHLDEKWACIRDNNFIRKNEHFWMERDEFLRRWTHSRDNKGWAVLLHVAVPPPPPRNPES